MSRNDPLIIVAGELEMANEEHISHMTTFSPSRSPGIRKVTRNTAGLEMMMNSVVDFCKINSSATSKSDTNDGDDNNKMGFHRRYTNERSLCMY